MWTILWTEKDGTDGWDRCEDREEMQTLLSKLLDRVYEYDILIFPPEMEPMLPEELILVGD